MTVTHISVKELANRWATNQMAIYRQVEAGELAALRIGRSIRIPIAAVERFESKNTTGVEPAPSRARTKKKAVS